MTNYSTGTFTSLTFKDYKEVLDPTNQIVELDQDKLLTNCICPHHKDNNPSLLLYKGNKVACVYHCYVCDRADVDREFKKLLIKKGKLNLNNLYTTTLNGLHEQGVINSFTLDKLLSVRKNRTGSLRAEGREPRGIVQQYKQQQGVANGI